MICSVSDFNLFSNRYVDNILGIVNTFALHVIMIQFTVMALYVVI